MNVTDLVRLSPLMELTDGRPEIRIGLIDGPVAIDHPDLLEGRVCSPGESLRACAPEDISCQHGTFVAGILAARRGSRAPSICPGCTLIVRPIFSATLPRGGLPSASPNELAQAIVECIEAGARLLNISAAIAQPSMGREQVIAEALARAIRNDVIVVAAAGNQSALGATAITGHPWVIPVVACGLDGRPLAASNLGSSVGRRGLRAPGDRVVSLGVSGQLFAGSGTSAATPFVTGTLALLWSEFPKAGAGELKRAVSPEHRPSIVPPLLDAWGAYEALLTARAERGVT